MCSVLEPGNLAQYRAEPSTRKRTIPQYRPPKLRFVLNSPRSTLPQNVPVRSLPKRKETDKGNKRAEAGEIHEASRSRCGHRRPRLGPFPHPLPRRSPIPLVAAPCNAFRPAAMGAHRRPVLSISPCPLQRRALHRLQRRGRSRRPAAGGGASLGGRRLAVELLPYPWRFV